MAKTYTRKDVGTVGQPSAPLSGAETQAREVAQRTSTVRRRNRTLIIIAAILGAVVIVVVLATIAGLTLNRSGDNVSTSPASPAVVPSSSRDEGVASPAQPATTSSNVGKEGVAPAQQAAASESAPAVTAKEFASGKYNLSQITASSSNVVVALFGAARENTLAGVGKYADRDAIVTNETSFHPFGYLGKMVKNPHDKSLLVVGSLRDPTNGKFLNSKEVVPDINYPVSVLFAEYGDTITYWVWRMDFLLYKTSSGEWRIRNFSPTVSHSLLPNYDPYRPNGWDADAFKKALARSNNEPFNLYR